MASQTGGTPKWFLSSVRDQMLSEIRVAKSRKLAPPHYVLKSESDEIVRKKPNSGESNGSFRLMAWTSIPSLLTEWLISGAILIFT